MAGKYDSPTVNKNDIGAFTINVASKRSVK
jgi:hypothetical protein